MSLSNDTVTHLLNRKQVLEADLAKTEAQLYDVESQYLSEYGPVHGSILKGFDSALSQNKSQQKKATKNKPEERLFSLSSKTSRVQLEVAEEKEAVRLATTASGRMTKSRKN